VVASEDYGALGGHVLTSHYFDPAEERVHDHAEEPRENPIGWTDRVHGCGHYNRSGGKPSRHRLSTNR
jgi:hypothetical protein